MRQILLSLLLIMVIGQAKSQIIITGFMSDPVGSDATADSRGFEYVQLMATEDITFSAQNSYSVVFARNAKGSNAADSFEGWSTGGSRTFKFNLTEGQVGKGKYFYVGGPEKVIAGYVKNGDVTIKTTGIGAPGTLPANQANWIRAIPYFSGTALGDGFGDGADNWMYNKALYLSSIGVFSGTTVTKTTVPIDAVFFGDPDYPSSRLLNLSDEDNLKGYMVPDNDLYKTADGGVAQPYFGQGTNTTVIGLQPADDQANFAKLGGVYHTSTKTWTTPRSVTYVTLMPAGTSADTPQLSDIETGSGLTTLPINLLLFTAKEQGSSVNLRWQTASEQNNHHFDILRSASSEDFNTIGTEFGKGTSNVTTVYSFQDAKPLNGINYYKLRQVDVDGKFTESKVLAVNAGFETTELKVNASVSKQELNVSIHSPIAGKGTIYITDITGRKLAEQEVNLEKGQMSLQIPVKLQNGVHVITLHAGEKQISTKFMF